MSHSETPWVSQRDFRSGLYGRVCPAVSLLLFQSPLHPTPLISLLRVPARVSKSYCYKCTSVMWASHRESCAGVRHKAPGGARRFSNRADARSLPVAAQSWRSGRRLDGVARERPGGPSRPIRLPRSDGAGPSDGYPSHGHWASSADGRKMGCQVPMQFGSRPRASGLCAGGL